MSKAVVYYDLFNSKAEEFIKEITTSFPNIKQFQTFRSGFSLLKNLDKKKPQDIFNTYVYVGYKDYIMQRNEEFFLNNEPEIKITSSKKDQWLEFIENIKGIWKSLDEENKDVIWKYFQVLVTLNEKCVNNT